MCKNPNPPTFSPVFQISCRKLLNTQDKTPPTNGAFTVVAALLASSAVAGGLSPLDRALMDAMKNRRSLTDSLKRNGVKFTGSGVSTLAKASSTASGMAAFQLITDGHENITTPVLLKASVISSTYSTLSSHFFVILRSQLWISTDKKFNLMEFLNHIRVNPHTLSRGLVASATRDFLFSIIYQSGRSRIRKNLEVIGFKNTPATILGNITAALIATLSTCTLNAVRNEILATPYREKAPTMTEAHADLARLARKGHWSQLGYALNIHFGIARVVFGITSSQLLFDLFNKSLNRSDEG